MNSDLYSMNHHQSHRGRSLLAGLVLLPVICGGCQSYSPKPLELSAHAAAFLARLPEPSSLDPATAASTTPATFDPSDGLSLPEAEALALVFNAPLRIARLDAGVSAAAAANAGLWEDPVLGVDLTRIIQSAPHPWKLASSVGLTIPISGHLTALKEEASSEHRAKLARVARDEWQVRIELRRAWLRYEALEAQLATLTQHLATADQVLAIVARMEEAGEIGRTEARLFRIERAGEVSQRFRVEAQKDAAVLTIRELLGLAPQAPLQLVVGGTVHTAVDASQSLEVLAQAAAATNQTLRVAQADYDVAEHTLARQIRRQYPDLQVGPGLGREDGDDQALLSLALPLPLLNANRQEIAKASAAREVAREQAGAALEQMISDLARAQTALHAAAAQRQLLESELMPLADAQYADARALAQLGEINTLILLEALKRQQEARASHIEATLEESLAAVRLEELVGPASPSLPQSRSATAPSSTTN
ncbi:MAG: TolC family protein [Planctomycetota bacterium]|nr:TolC family protein [Planctomycetota bacterium]